MKTKHHALFLVPVLVALAFSLPRTAAAKLVKVSPFTPSAPAITFSEFPAGTVDPASNLNPPPNAIVNALTTPVAIR